MRKNRKIKYCILMIIVIAIILIICIFNKKSDDVDTGTVTTSETKVIKTDIVNTVSNSSYIVTGLEENKELHATYYFEEIYFEKNQYISAGENILKYTNGQYLIAPYNCVITDFSIPNEGEICTNKHYITLQSTDTLKISLEIEEDELDTIYVSQEAEIEVESLQDKIITGYVTNINNTATYSSSGSTFGVDVEFQNDGEILLGMSAKCSVILEKAENVIAVANEAIKQQNNEKYVTIKLDDGTTKDVEVETGIENDAYTEIKSGLNEGDIVLIEQESNQQNQRQNGMNQKMDRGGAQGGFSERNGGEAPQMPSGSQTMGAPQN